MYQVVVKHAHVLKAFKVSISEFLLRVYVGEKNRG
jgi:hypothetical protein